MTAPFLYLLQESFAKHAARPALAHQGRTWTYGELDAQVRKRAAWFQGLHFSAPERVVLCTPHKLAFLIGHLATLYVGAIALPLNPRFSRAELRFFLEDSKARQGVFGEEVLQRVHALFPDAPDLCTVLPDETMPESRMLGSYNVPHLTADDPCLLMYSSGTTGWPKGIVHTHGNVASALLALQKCWRFTPEDVVLNVLPLFHVHGLAFATLLPLLSGACVILDDLDPQTTMERIKDCTVFMAVPTIYYRLLEQANFREMARTWTNTRLFTCGSAPIRAEVLPELESILGKPVINRYGMTEAFVITSLPLDGPWPNGSVGKPVDGIEVRVIGDSSNCPRDVPSPGALRTLNEESPGVGAVQIRGPNLFRKYWHKPDATRDAFSNGWFDTGDLGYLDDDGFLTLVGRKNDLIITSGFNVYPQVVERVLNECPGVRESAVLGVPDDRKGERVVAVIVRDDPALDEDRLRAHWNERLVDYQRPRDVIFVEALPRNSMGKVLRRELRDKFTGS